MSFETSGSDGSVDASPRGDPSQRYPLSFVRVQPYVVPKKSLSVVTTLCCADAFHACPQNTVKTWTAVMSGPPR